MSQEHLEGGVNALETTVKDISRGCVEMNTGFAEMRGKLDATASGQRQIADLIQRLIG